MHFSLTVAVVLLMLGHHTEAYNCVDNNPCNPLLVKYQYHYKADVDSETYVRCSAYGYCFELFCMDYTIWDDSIQSCNSE